MWNRELSRRIEGREQERLQASQISEQELGMSLDVVITRRVGGGARCARRPSDTSPGEHLMRSSSRAGSAIEPKLQSRMRLPLSVTKGSPVGDRRSRALAPSTSRVARVLLTRRRRPPQEPVRTYLAGP